MADLWLVIVATSAICGLAAHIYARNTGRNVVRWTVLGVVFNLFALAFLCRRKRRA